MIDHEVRVWPSKTPLPAEKQLAYKLAQLACDPVPLDADVTGMVINRLIDNMGVAIAALGRHPVQAAYAQALAHPRPGGAVLFGSSGDRLCAAEWVGWANAVAVRELDYHDSFFDVEFAHPGDCISPILAVAQQMGCNGVDLAATIATSYEIQVDLCKGIPLNAHHIDHVGHLAPAVAGALGRLLRLPVEVVYQAIQQAVHTSYATRQSRRGMISSWKAYACAHAGKLAVEAVDRAMRGEASPSPIYEGEASVIASMLDGPEARYTVPLPAPGEPKRAIMETFTKEHSAAYHGQPLIDLAFRMRPGIPDVDAVESIRIFTKHMTHRTTGTGTGDPQRMDPHASRETLDHSVMFMFAVALQDGSWDHHASYAPERVRRPDTVALWHKIETVEDPEWNRRYDEVPGIERAHGGRAEILLKDGTRIVDEIHTANAHPAGKCPFARVDYIRKFETLALQSTEAAERRRFLDLVQRLPELEPAQLRAVNLAAPGAFAEMVRGAKSGIF
ncbi:MmgE/PrpD family protein [Bosea sp. 117]|uniref:MmgE/PrpD family protein n=1 Tax=Bosea sp. 117 TaxID=1125973 RepID=UPI0004947CA6|nr:MmgE/PrpD family protein [Bosea sp. 117]